MPLGKSTMEPQYFLVVGGNRYGPANVDLLNQWATEGRVTAGMQAEQEGTGVTMPVEQIPGIKLSPGAPPPAPPAGGPMPPGPGTGSEQSFASPPTMGANYYRPQYQYSGAPVDPVLSKRVTTTLILSIVSLLFCCIGGIFAIIYANQAQTALRRGDVVAVERSIKNANGWLWVNFIVGALVWIFRIIGIVGAVSGHPPYNTY